MNSVLSLTKKRTSSTVGVAVKKDRDVEKASVNLMEMKITEEVQEADNRNETESANSQGENTSTRDPPEDLREETLISEKRDDAYITQKDTTDSKLSLGGVGSSDLLFCDYDQNPTLLYKFIEYREWGEVLERIRIAPEEASIWVVRYEEHSDDATILSSMTRTLRWRLLPIHASVMFNAPLKVVAALHRAFMNGLKTTDDRKMLPVHLACRVVSNTNVSTYLIYNSADVLGLKDYKGRTPLTILKQYRSKAADKQDVGFEKEIKSRDALIKIMETKFPSTSDDANASEEIRKTKQSKAKISSKAKLFNGKRFRSKVGSFTSNSEREEKVFRVQENEPIQQNKAQSYPTTLIKLVEHKMWQEVIERCVDVPEEASRWMCRMQQVNDVGNKKREVRWKILPIHSAIVLHAPVEVIEALTDAYPEGLEKGDDRLMLPLHMAFRLGSSPEVAAILVDSYPEALTCRDSKGHTPLHILRAYRKKYDKEKAEGKPKSDAIVDRNRRALIKFYSGRSSYERFSRSRSQLKDMDSGTVYDDDSSDYSTDSDDDSDDEYDDDDDFFTQAVKGLVGVRDMACH